MGRERSNRRDGGRENGEEARQQDAAQGSALHLCTDQLLWRDVRMCHCRRGEQSAVARVETIVGTPVVVFRSLLNDVTGSSRLL